MGSVRKAYRSSKVVTYKVPCDLREGVAVAIAPRLISGSATASKARHTDSTSSSTDDGTTNGPVLIATSAKEAPRPQCGRGVFLGASQERSAHKEALTITSPPWEVATAAASISPTASRKAAYRCR